MKKWLCLIFAALALTACGTANQLRSSETFNAKSPDSIVIIGLANDPYNGLPHGMQWRAIDPETHTLTDDPKAVFISKLSSWEFGEMAYFAYRIPAGTYVLDQIGGGAGSGPLSRGYQIRFRPKTVGVRVGPGEIVYVGNHLIGAWPDPDNLFDRSKLHKKFKYSGADLAAVRKKLGEYPNVIGEVVHRVPEPVELNLPNER